MAKLEMLTEFAAPWRDVLLVCGKCTRKLKGGFGRKGRHALRSELKDALRGRRSGLKVIELGCMGLCPKGAVTVMRASQPNRLLAVPAGTDMDILADRFAANSADMTLSAEGA